MTERPKSSLIPHYLTGSALQVTSGLAAERVWSQFMSLDIYMLERTLTSTLVLLQDCSYSMPSPEAEVVTVTGRRILRLHRNSQGRKAVLYVLVDY